MQSFFQQSHYFWVVSRLLLVIAFIISLLGIFFGEDLRNMYELLANLLGFIYTVGMAVLSVMELSKRTLPTWLRVSVGILSLLLGLTLAGVILFVGTSNGLLLIFPLWIVMLGVWDLTPRVVKAEEEEYL